MLILVSNPWHTALEASPRLKHYKDFGSFSMHLLSSSPVR